MGTVRGLAMAFRPMGRQADTRATGVMASQIIHNSPGGRWVLMSIFQHWAVLEAVAQDLLGPELLPSSNSSLAAAQPVCAASDQCKQYGLQLTKPAARAHAVCTSAHR
jgi:hypothetical protein